MFIKDSDGKWANVEYIRRFSVVQVGSDYYIQADGDMSGTVGGFYIKTDYSTQASAQAGLDRLMKTLGAVEAT